MQQWNIPQSEALALQWLIGSSPGVRRSPNSSTRVAVWKSWVAIANAHSATAISVPTLAEALSWLAPEVLIPYAILDQTCPTGLAAVGYTRSYILSGTRSDGPFDELQNRYLVFVSERIRPSYTFDGDTHPEAFAIRASTSPSLQAFELFQQLNHRHLDGQPNRLLLPSFLASYDATLGCGGGSWAAITDNMMLATHKLPYGISAVSVHLTERYDDQINERPVRTLMAQLEGLDTLSTVLPRSQEAEAKDERLPHTV